MSLNAMATGDFPTFVGSSYASHTFEPETYLAADNALKRMLLQGGAAETAVARRPSLGNLLHTPVPINQPKEATPMTTARIVKVFIADPNDNIPLEKRVLYSGPEKLTDLTDQELFFEVDIAGILTKHNEVRAFLAKYYGSAVGQDVQDPLHSATAKARFGLVTVHGEPYEIADIGMRMLTPRELFRAQGFPDSYIIDRGADGRKLTKTEQIRMCGNEELGIIIAEAMSLLYRAAMEVRR